MLSARPWNLELVLQFLLRLVACFCLGMLTGQLLASWLGSPDAPSTRFLLFLVFTLSFHGAVIILAHLCLREHALSWNDAFGFLAPRLGHTLLLAAAATVLALPVAWFLGRASDQLMRLVHLEPALQAPVEILRQTASLPARVVFGTVAIGLAPLAEEILFRGLLYGVVRQFGFPRLALWGSSLLFALTHFNLMTFLPLFVLAVILAFLYECTRNLLAPILAHSLFNAVNFVCLVYDASPLV